MIWVSVQLQVFFAIFQSPGSRVAHLSNFHLCSTSFLLEVALDQGKTNWHRASSTSQWHSQLDAVDVDKKINVSLGQVFEV